MIPNQIKKSIQNYLEEAKHQLELFSQSSVPTKPFQVNHFFLPLSNAMLNIANNAPSVLITSHQAPATHNKPVDEPIHEELDNPSLGMSFR